MTDVKWQELTGSSSTLLTQAGKYQSIGEAIRRSTTSLKNIINENESVSEAVDALRELAQKVHDDISLAESRYTKTGELLATYAGVLSSAKQQADPAAKALRSLRTQESAAITSENNTHYEWTTAEWYYKRAQSDPATLPEELERLRLRESSTRYTYNAAVNRRTGIQRDIRTQETIWTGGYDTKRRAGDLAEADIHDLVAFGPGCGMNDTWWDKWGPIFDRISFWLGIASFLFSWFPALSLVLGGLSLLFSLVTLIGNWVSTGKPDWVAVAFFLLSAVPFIGKATKFVKAAKGTFQVATAASEAWGALKMTFTPSSGLNLFERVLAFTGEAAAAEGHNLARATGDLLSSEVAESIFFWGWDLVYDTTITVLGELYQGPPPPKC